IDSDSTIADTCCSPVLGIYSSADCADSYAVNIASGSLLYRYKVPENTIPIQLSYESDQPGFSTIGNGWRANYHRKITRIGTVVTVTCGDGCNVPYTQDGTATFTYYPSAGVDNILSQSASVSMSY